MFKYTFTFFILLFTQTLIIAQNNIPVGTPICNNTFAITNQNGENFSLRGQGDSRLHWFETEENYPVIKVNDFYYFAKIEGNQLVSSGIKLSDTNIKKHKKSIAAYKTDFHRYLKSQVSSIKTMKTIGGVPSTGEIRIPVLLVEFADRLHTRDKANIEAMFMSDNHDNYGSLHQYYLRASHNALDIQFDVYGWYQSDIKLSEVAESLGGDKAGKLVRKAVQLAHTAGVDFSLYDNDKDGDVDAVLVVHAGLGADHYGQKQYIWPRSWSLENTVGKAQVYNSISVNDYVIACEMRSFENKWKDAGIGTFAHEFGHALGLPDLYDGTSKSNGLGHWGLMSAGSWLGNGYRPGNFCAWSRIKLGWDTPKKINYNDFGQYSLNASTTQDEIYQINSISDNEYFLLENRTQSENDVAQPGEGLAIYHIDKTKANQRYGVNDDRDHPGVQLVEADFNKNNGLYNAKDRGVASDLFSCIGTTRDFGPYTSPNSNLFDGSPSNIWIRNISNQNGIYQFSLDQVTGIKNVASAQNFTCYPNPFRDNINIRSSSKDFRSVQLSVFNSSGSMVYTKKFETFTGSQAINLQFLPSGTYILQIRTPRQVFVQKLMKTN